MVFYSAHGGDKMFYRVSVKPEDISAWTGEASILTNTTGPNGFTYPNPYTLKREKNRIYLFWRGGDFQPSFATSDDGTNWSDAQTLIAGTEVYKLSLPVARRVASPRIQRKTN